MVNIPSISSNSADGLIKKLAQMGQQAAKELSNKLAKIPQDIAKTMIGRFNQRMETLEYNVEEMYQIALQQCKEIMKGPKIRIEIPSHLINFAKHSSQLEWIKGKAIFYRPCSTTKLEVDCVVACGHWHKLGEIKEKMLNIIDHLDKLLPSKTNTFGQKGPIGLITFQNGMMNKFEDEVGSEDDSEKKSDFSKMSALISQQFPEKPLCIGLYNPTTGNILKDMYRFQNEASLNKLAVYSLCQMVKSFADLIPTINPNLLWTHFAHSEGGLIANAVLELCEQWWLENTRKYLENHLITVTYGAVKPIAKEYVLDAINTYSKNDIALFFGKHYIDKKLNEISVDNYESIKFYQGKTYRINVMDSTTKNEPVIHIPERLSFEERLQLSFWEHLGHQELALPHSYDLISHHINDLAYQIVDHGFAKSSYQKYFGQDVAYLRKTYKIYNSMIDR
ncbi:MAG: hypothetical protein H0V82_11465 [Candidatus Protochlamydia sp.]|nr:hypothetical protein [Candidatus Protochlamydia sp.]